MQDAFPALSFGDNQSNDNRILGAITLGVLAVVVYLGMTYISKVAFFFFFGVLLAIFSIFLGKPQCCCFDLLLPVVAGADLVASFIYKSYAST